MAQSYTRFDFFASGRKNVIHTELKFFLKKRHCLLSNFIADPILGTSDQLYIEVPLDPNNDNLRKPLPPIEFMICKMKDYKNKCKELKQIETMCKSSKCKSYTVKEDDMIKKDTYMVLAEHDDIANGIVTKKIGDVLKTMNQYNQSYLNEIHITDFGIYHKSPLYLRAIIDLPSDISNQENLQIVQGLIDMIFEMADTVATMRIPQGVLDKCSKSRAKYR